LRAGIINPSYLAEYLNDYQIDNIEEAKELLEVVVELYNNERPDMSMVNLTPNQVHKKNRKILEELLSKKSCYSKPIIGLKMSCKSILGKDCIQSIKSRLFLMN
jgi:hypothetical protein